MSNGGRSQRHIVATSPNMLPAKNNDAAYMRPRQVTAPTKSGTATQGQTLTGVNGTVKGGDGAKITITRQWIRGTNTVIAGATNATYVVQAADVGQTLKFRNICRNYFGVTNIDSTPTAVVS